MIQRLRNFFDLLNARDKLNFGILLGLMVFGSLLEVAGVGAIPAFIVLLREPDSINRYEFLRNAREAVGITSDNELLLWAALLLILLFLVKNAYRSFLIYVRARYVYNRQLDLCHRLLGAYLYGPYEYYLSQNTSKLIRNIDKEVPLTVQGVMLPVVTILMESLLVIFIVAVLVAVEPVVSLVSIVGLGGISYLFLTLVRSKVHVWGKIVQQLRFERMKNIEQGLNGLKDARIMGREEYFINQSLHSEREYVRALRFKELVSGLPAPFLETLTMVGILLVTAILVYQNDNLNTLIPILALFATASLKIMPSLTRVVRSITDLRYNLPAVDEIIDELGRLEAAADRQKALARTVSVLPYRTRLEVRDLCFRYENADRLALDHVSLTIEPNSSVAFVGPSGSGKTTLVNLLLGMFPPSAGAIYVDGEDIHTNIRSWQTNIGHISQNIYLLDDTIRRNIAYGLLDHEIDDEKVVEALYLAQLGEFIEGLPEGIHTQVGQQGVKISGGQRQRVAIARALYHNPNVLILDEATSSLDNKTEKNIIQSLELLRGKRTLITVAHRLSTVENCDVLYFLKEGRLTASGSFRELLDGSEDFRRIANVEEEEIASNVTGP